MAPLLVRATSASAGVIKRALSAFTGFTTKKKIAAAVVTNVMAAVMKAPYRKHGVVDREREVAEVRLADDHRDDRHDQAVDERRDERCEREAQHERDGELDEVAAHEEVSEFLEHGGACLSVS